jgi:TolB-like protein/Tfp pilus assembly protein PilF
MLGEAPESRGGQPPNDPPASVEVPNASIHVFVSYASQDVAVADAVVEGLERHGLRCWIAPRDVVPGESYAGAIVHAIDATKLIVLILSKDSATSQHVLREVERASSKRHPLVAFRIDLAPMPADLEYFLNTSQWLDARTMGVERAMPKLVDAVQRILAPAAVAQSEHVGDTSKPITMLSATRRVGAQTNRRLSRALIAFGALIALALGYFGIDRFWLSKRSAMEHPVVPVAAVASGAAPAVSAPPSFNPPPHSIAVLPFVNMSGDKEQEYFSDGLTEELLNSLARINELQVAGRTSSFYFKGEHADLTTIAYKLNVASVLEGSVRRSGQTVRITAQLIDAVTGFHLWSQTYDRNLGDILALQSEIADAVADALRVTLLGDVAAKVELGGTHNPAAFDAYLRAAKTISAYHDKQDVRTAIAEFSEAIRLDPNYALAFVGRARALVDYADEFATGPAVRQSLEQAETDARKAIMLAPSLAEAHLALAEFFNTGALDYVRASEEYARAAALAPGDARVLRLYGRFAVLMGRSDVGIPIARRAVLLDPLSRDSHFGLGRALYAAWRYDEATAALQDALTLDGNDSAAYAARGLAYYALGNLQNARGSCENKPDYWVSQLCLAVTYDKLGRHADAETMLAKLRASNGDDAAYQYAEIYAQWGNTPKALEWLEMAMRVRDPGLEQLKTDELLDPLRKEARFQAIERALKFPT